MKGVSRSPCTSSPLIIPASVPTPRATIRQRKGFRAVAVESSPATRLERPAMAATERSMPPISSTRVWPNDTSMMNDTWRKSVEMLYGVKNTPVRMWTMIDTTSTTAKTAAGVDRSACARARLALAWGACAWATGRLRIRSMSLLPVATSCRARR